MAGCAVTSGGSRAFPQVAARINQKTGSRKLNPQMTKSRQTYRNNGQRQLAGWFRFCAGLLSSGLLSGCLNPNFVSLPRCTPSFPQADNMSYQRQDPFPDPDIGPTTDSSPQEYDRPRTIPRRAAEQRVLQGLPVGPESVPPGTPRGGLRRPQAVN